MWHDDQVLLPDLDRDDALIAQAVDTAKKADVVLLVLGDNEQTCREGWSTNHLGDRYNLDLPGRQEDLLQAVHATGKAVILLLILGQTGQHQFCCRTYPSDPGSLVSRTGRGHGDRRCIVRGCESGGKLPITFPRSAGQIPAYYYHKPSAWRGYLFTSVEPLFSFGHGLSYTSFAYSNRNLSKDKIAADETVTLSVNVTNTGKREEMRLSNFMCMTCSAHEFTRPVKLLKGFSSASHSSLVKAVH